MSDWVPLSVREGSWQKRLAWRVKGLRLVTMRSLLAAIDAAYALGLFAVTYWVLHDLWAAGASAAMAITRVLAEREP